MYEIPVGEEIKWSDLLRKYADYFDVSMDYIFANCNDTHSKLYEVKPPTDTNNLELRKFIEMCSNSESPMNEKPKETIMKIIWRREDE